MQRCNRHAFGANQYYVYNIHQSNRIAEQNGVRIVYTKNSRARSVETHGDSEFHRGLGLFDSTMLVIGVMIGPGIFIVSADMSREIGSPGWLLVAWMIAGALTVAGALFYGELSGMMPQAGGMYVYLREAYSPLWGFLYGWTRFTVIQTGTIAAVAVAFARFSGVLLPAVSEEHYLIRPWRISTRAKSAPCPPAEWAGARPSRR